MASGTITHPLPQLDKYASIKWQNGTAENGRLFTITMFTTYGGQVESGYKQIEYIVMRNGQFIVQAYDGSSWSVIRTF